MRRRRRNTRLERIFLAVVLGLLLAFGASVWWEVGDAGGEGSEAGAAPDTADGRPPPRVEVLNGAGEPGIAETTAERLRSRGFDVVFFGNAENFDFASTRVIARSDRVAAARRLADEMGVDRVRREPRPDLHLDATVILGADWKQHVPSASRGRGGADPDAGR